MKDHMVVLRGTVHTVHMVHTAPTPWTRPRSLAWKCPRVSNPDGATGRWSPDSGPGWPSLEPQAAARQQPRGRHPSPCSPGPGGAHQRHGTGLGLPLPGGHRMATWRNLVGGRAPVSVGAY